MENILDILIKLAGSLAGVAIVYAAKVACTYLNQMREDDKLDRFVTSAVAAAEQTLKEHDEDGSARMDYVQSLLIEAGYSLTGAVIALIESKVYALNTSK